jgi:hypothetical protein
LNTHETVLELMKIKLPNDVKSAVVSACLELMQMVRTFSVHNLFRLSFNIHIQFCKNNAENQTVLLDHVNFFLDFLDNPSLTVQVAQTVTEVFLENKAICSQVTENQIRKFLNQMAKRKHRAYLDFLFVSITNNILRNLTHLAGYYGSQRSSLATEPKSSGEFVN